MDKTIIRGIWKLLFGNWYRFGIIVIGTIYLYKLYA